MTTDHIAPMIFTTSLPANRFATLLLASFAATELVAQTLFVDDFNAGASPLWSNESGAWVADGGTYHATAPNNFPNANSSLPYLLTDGSVDVDILAPDDGGVWLRSAPAPGTVIGRQGVLLVFARGQLYWHVVVDGTSYGPAQQPVGGVYTPRGSEIHLRVTMTGDQYAVFVNGAATATTSLTDATFRSGYVALYAYAGQRYDNFRLDAPALSLSDPNLRAPDRFECRVRGLTDTAFAIETSTDLKTWTEALTGRLASTPFDAVLTVLPDEPHRFFRAVPR